MNTLLPLGATFALSSYAIDVASTTPGVALAAAAIALGAIALQGLAPAAPRSRPAAWVGAGAVVLAVLHARGMPGEAPWLTTQLGLAAFVAATGASALVSPRARPRLAWVVGAGATIGLALALPAGEAVAGVVGGVLAAARPFTVMALAAARDPDDPWLAWSPIAPSSRGAS